MPYKKRDGDVMSKSNKVRFREKRTLHNIKKMDFSSRLCKDLIQVDLRLGD